MVDKNLINDEELLKSVEVKCDHKRIVEEDSWLDGANCIHLAAKFMPMGMELLFSASKDLPKLTDSRNKNGRQKFFLSKSTIIKIFLQKFHGLVLGSVELIDVKGIGMAQPIWL